MISDQIALHLVQRVGFLRCFGMKTGIHFTHFGLESGWVFEGSTGVFEWVYRFNSKGSKKERENRRIRNGFEEFFLFVL